MKRIAPLFAYLLVAGGCDLYWGHHQCDPTAGTPIIASSGARDPVTGVCHYTTGGTDACGNPVPTPLEGDSNFKTPVVDQDWGICPSACEAYDETTCLAADGCRAIYTQAEACGGPGGSCAWVDTFAACWSTAPSGPVRGVSCDGLDAHECSRHDDCSAVHGSGTTPGQAIGDFDHCQAETCSHPFPGISLRDPQSGQCETIGGGCVALPLVRPDWADCTSACTGLDQTTCEATDGCRAIFVDPCPAGDCALPFVYNDCWATAPSGPIRGGGCASLDAQTCSEHDDCIANHDGIGGGAGGFLACADETTPPPPPPACDTITDEMTCIARADCQPEYNGSDCSCDASGCHCNVWTFIACHAL
jgi:hypothetical protein